MDRTRGYKRLIWRTALSCNGEHAFVSRPTRTLPSSLEILVGPAAPCSSTLPKNGTSSSRASRKAISTTCSNDASNPDQLTH